MFYDAWAGDDCIVSYPLSEQPLSREVLWLLDPSNPDGCETDFQARESIRQVLEEAEKLGDCMAFALLANMVKHSQFCSQPNHFPPPPPCSPSFEAPMFYADRAEAEQLQRLNRGAEQGVPSAELALASLLERTDPNRHLELLRQAARQCCTAAIVQLCELLNNGASPFYNCDEGGQLLAALVMHTHKFEGLGKQLCHEFSDACLRELVVRPSALRSLSNGRGKTLAYGVRWVGG